jgi:hypothetical protein
MDKKKHFDKMKLDQLRNDIRAGIASGDAGTLDVDEIKRRGRRKAGNKSSNQRRQAEFGYVRLAAR